MSAPADPGNTDIAVDVLLANLARLYGGQLAEANIEAARWRAVAQAQAGELATLRHAVNGSADPGGASRGAVDPT